jgi:hypothetical protein
LRREMVLLIMNILPVRKAAGQAAKERAGKAIREIERLPTPPNPELPEERTAAGYELRPVWKPAPCL